MEKEKIYTQEDMDNITSKVKESTIAKYEQTHISNDVYKELEDKYNQLIQQNKNDFVKGVFVNSNGNEKAYDDFIKSHPDLLNIEDKEQLKQSIDDLSKNKHWYFDKIPSVPGEDETVKSMLKTNNDDIFEGTIISNNWTIKK